MCDLILIVKGHVFIKRHNKEDQSPAEQKKMRIKKTKTDLRADMRQCWPIRKTK